MKEQLYQLFQGTTGAPTVEDLLLRVGVSVVIGLAIFVSYWISHAGTIYSQKFNINLITLTILTATVMTVIGNNIALSLGMVGALSIVRFRTAIKDPRDTTYIFWAIITGLGITLLVVFGIKAIANFATVFVPLFVIVVIVAAAIILQNHSLTELLTTAPPGPALSLGAATTMVAGGFIAGAICTPDYARFLKNGTQVFWMTLIGTFVGELGMKSRFVISSKKRSDSFLVSAFGS